MTIGQFVLDPLLAWPTLALLAAAALLVTLPGLRRRARGTLLRALGFLLLLALLAGPSWIAQTRRPLPDIALLIVDRSQSMALANRAALAERAAASLRAGAAAAGIELRTIDLPPAPDGGTALFARLHDALAAIPPPQLAGIIALTDGQIADAPAALATAAPLTALLTAGHEETDRELRLIDSPGYGLVGQTLKLRVEILDHGTQHNGTPIPITITEDGRTLARQTAAIGTPLSLNLPVRHAGPNIVQIAVPPLPGEISAVNDQAVFTLNGIQHRLNILLISGSPDLGERAWRLLLKSDPATQLVHFTILRTPGETIDADPADLALVPFPVEQLFGPDIGKFDLIILDRFNADDLLPDRYLANIANYVENGGAVFAEFGPEFASGQSLALSSLGNILPAQPSDPGTLIQPFAPSITALGARHPVTAPFAGTPLAPWYRMEAATQTAGDVLMTGVNGAPLLILGGAGAGRIGILLSDQFWLWTRGGGHAGPALPLLRRIVHWLLREPDLEAEALSAQIENNQLFISRQTLSPSPPAAMAVTAPDGTSRQLPPVATSPGRYQAALPAPQQGVWKVTEGTLTAYAANTLDNTTEYQNLAATATILRPLASNTIWLGTTPAPPLRDLIRPRHATAVTATTQTPIIPPLPATLIALALLSAAWWREGRE